MNNFYWKNEKPENVIRSASWHPLSTTFIFFFLLSIPFAFCLSHSPPSTPVSYFHQMTNLPVAPCRLPRRPMHRDQGHIHICCGKRLCWSAAVSGGHLWTLGYHVLGCEPTTTPHVPWWAWSPVVEQGHSVLVCPWEPWDRPADGFVRSWPSPPMLCRRWLCKCCSSRSSSTSDSMATSDCPFHSMHPELIVYIWTVTVPR